MVKGGSDLSELAYLEKGGAADIRDMFGEGKSRIEGDVIGSVAMARDVTERVEKGRASTPS